MFKQLMANDVHVYLEPALNGLSSEAMQNLSCSEQIRAKRFIHVNDQRLYVSAHHLLRNVLSHYTDISPQDWHFANNQYGRPEIANRHHDVNKWLKFNLTHSSGWVACIITRDNFAGIDLEACRPINELESLYDLLLTTGEKEECVSKYADIEYFYSYWTLKESYIKARGMGLSLPLKSFGFYTLSQQPWQLQLICSPSFSDGIQWKSINYLVKKIHMLSITFTIPEDMTPNITLHYSSTLKKSDFTVIASSF